MEQHHSESAVLVGSSTHNERIERLWRYVHRCVAVLFADLFRGMEAEGILSCLNEVDLFCLHWVFVPRINSVLDSFTESWNNHPLSSSQNLTPNQLFIQGALRQNMTPALPIPVHSSSSIQLPTLHDAVGVPRSAFAAFDDLKSELDQLNVLRETDDFGYSLYQNACHIVGQHLFQCTECT